MEGIVINAIEYKEKSKIVYLYTPNGLVSVKALDVKTKLPFVTSLNVVEFNMSNSKFPTLIEYNLRRTFYSFHTDISKLNIVFIFISIIKAVDNNAPHSRIYKFLLECLDLLENCNDYRWVLCLFLIKMLYIFGVKPNLENCVVCGKQNIVNFSINSGGALCDCCANYNENGYKIYSDMKLFYYSKDYDESLFKNINYDLLIENVYQYYSIHVNLHLNNYKIK